MSNPITTRQPRQTIQNTHFRLDPARKSALVDLGLQALSRGDWLMVMAITAIIRKRGWSHD